MEGGIELNMYMEGEIELKMYMEGGSSIWKVESS